MEAVVLHDGIGLAGQDCLLRAEAGALPAADAGIGDLEAAGLRMCLAERECVALDRRCAEVEELDLSFCDAEGLERIAGISWIDVVHGRVFLEDAVDPGVRIVLDALCCSHEPHHLPVFRERIDCDVRIAQELRVEVLAARGAEDEGALLLEHHIDDADLGVSLLVDGSERNILDLSQHVQARLCIQVSLLRSVPFVNV